MSDTSVDYSGKDRSSENTATSGISGTVNGIDIAITDDLQQQSLTGKTAAETGGQVSTWASPPALASVV